MTLKRENLLNKRVAIIFIIFLAALGVRLIALKQNYVIAQDGVFYIKMAKLISAGDYDHELLGKHQHYAFFPLLILLFHKIVAEWILAGQLVGVLCGAGAVIPLYFLAKRIFAEKVALLAAIFYIICPNLVRYSAEILRDIPSVFFYTMGLWWGYKGIKDGRVVFMGLASLFIVLSTCLRVEGLTLLVSLLLFLFWYGLKNDIPWKKRLSILGSLLFSVFAILIIFGLFTTIKGINIGTRQFAGVKSALLSGDQTIRNIEKEVEEKPISQKLRDFFYLARKHRFVLYSSHVFYKLVKVFNILFVLFLFGLINRRQIEYRQDEFLLFTIYALFVPVFFLYLINTNYLSTRHPFFLVVPSLIWSAVGFVELKQRAIRWMKGGDFPLRDRVLRWVTIFLLLLICIPLLSMAWRSHRKDKLELKEIGLWLKKNGYAHSVIVGQHEFLRLAFYADGEFIHLPRGSSQDIMRLIREKKADLLVINGRTIDRFFPNFLELVSPGDFQRIHIPGIKTPKYATLVFGVKELRHEE